MKKKINALFFIVKVNKLKSFSEDAGVTNSTILSDYDKIS